MIPIERRRRLPIMPVASQELSSQRTGIGPDHQPERWSPQVKNFWQDHSSDSRSLARTL